MAIDADRDFSVVVPVFNEIDNLEPLVERIRRAFSDLDLDWELILVDDGSDDGSSEKMDEISALDERLVVLHLDRRNGQSAGLDAGFRHSRGRYIGIIDADLQTYPEDFPLLLERLKSDGVDAVIGIRAERRDTWWKRASSKVANGVRNRLTHEDVVDTGCPLKIFRREAIRSVKMFDGIHRFLPTLLKMEGWTVAQMPVHHTQRQAGASKYGTWDRAFRGLYDAMAVRWMQTRHMKWRLR